MSNIIAPASYASRLSSFSYLRKMDQVLRFNLVGIQNRTTTVENVKEQIRGFFVCNAWAVRPRGGFIGDLQEHIINAETCLYYAQKNSTKKADLVRLLERARKILWFPA